MEGEIRFIEPFLGERTRTVAVRVEVPNPNRLLKPGMFVQGRVAAQLGRQEHELPLVIPHTAPLRTGKRAIVYVAVPDSDEPLYEGRTVQLGPRAGDYFVVEAGLDEGEQVVVQGAFKIDAALQISAKPAMMSMPSENLQPAIPVRFVTSLQPVYAGYFSVWKALKDDNPELAQQGFKVLHDALPGVENKLLELSKQRQWTLLNEPLMKHVMAGLNTAVLADLRRHFEPVSKAMLGIERTFGHSGGTDHFEMYCPMAFENRGAVWLQDDKGLLNPYFGAAMLRCGEVQETFPPLQDGDLQPPPHALGSGNKGR